MDAKMSPLNRLTAKMKQNKKLEIGIYVGIGLLIVILYLTGMKPSQTNTQQAQQPAAQPLEARDDEARLKNALSQIKGAGKVEVMLTYENGRELVPALSTDTQSSSQAGDQVSNSEATRPVTLSKSGEEEPIVLKEVEPKIRGVIVIAQGADDIKVRMDLARAVSKVLDVTMDRIEVFTMEAEEKGGER